MRCHRKTICVRSTPHANSPSPELALEFAIPEEWAHIEQHPQRLAALIDT
jgi:hypothetical protein